MSGRNKKRREIEGEQEDGDPTGSAFFCLLGIFNFMAALTMVVVAVVMWAHCQAEYNLPRCIFGKRNTP